MHGALTDKETVILRLLADGRTYYGLQIVAESGGSVGKGTVYVTLDRMEDKGFVSSEQEDPQNASGRPRRFYRTTDLGRRMLEATRQAEEVIEEAKADYEACLPACGCATSTAWLSRRRDGEWNEDVAGGVLEQRTCLFCGYSLTREV